MALVAVDAVVDVPRHVVVMEVVRIVAPMTSRALEHRVIVGVRVAGRANAVGVAVARGELRVLRMVEGCSRPCSSVVAVLARCREELLLRLVPRVCCVLVIRLVAAVTVRRQRRVVAIHVAIRTNARRHRVRSRQRKGRVVVIEG